MILYIHIERERTVVFVREIPLHFHVNWCSPGEEGRVPSAALGRGSVALRGSKQLGRMNLAAAPIYIYIHTYTRIECYNVVQNKMAGPFLACM